MIIQDLIDILKTKDPSSRVVVSGYEDGFSDIQNIKEIGLKINVNREDYYGPHGEAENEADEKAVFIQRANNPLGC